MPTPTPPFVMDAPPSLPPLLAPPSLPAPLPPLQSPRLPTTAADIATTPRPRANFSFSNNALKLLLVQSVREHDAQIAVHGKKDAIFKLVLSTFLAHVSSRMRDTHNKPSVKTLRDKYESLANRRKETNSCNERASGITEDVSEVDQVLNDLILKREEVDEDKKMTKEVATKREKSLEEAAKGIRNSMMKRVRKENQEDSEKKKKRVRIDRNADEDMDEWTEMVKKELSERKETKKRENELRGRELDVMQQRWDADRKEKETHLQLLAALINKLK